MNKLNKYLRAHIQLITILVGTALVSAWTLLRFWSARSIFDLVGQQVLTNSFFQDGSLDASVGATHYLVKMLFVYAPFHALGVEPRFALIFMTLLLNITAYMGIFFAIKSILRSFNVLRPKTFYVAMVWLAAVAGSVFWIEFANSRNIEVAAGLWAIALGLHFLKSPTVKRAVIWGFVATIAFFMDPLQVYMTGIPLFVYVLISELLPQPKTVGYKRIVMFALALGGAYILSKWLLILIIAITGIHVISDTSSALGLGGIIEQFGHAIKGQITANIRLIAGVVEDGGRLRQLIALLGMSCALVTWILYAIRRKFNLKFVIFVVTFSVVIQVVYLLSGQSMAGDTSRYLIMFAPILVIIVASLPATIFARVGLSLVATVVLVNAIFLGISLTRAWPDRFQQDQQLSTVAAFANANSTVRFYASMDTALPTMYYYPSAAILPLSCSANGVERAHTFYPNSSYDKHQNERRGQAGIILDAGGYISNYPNTCSKSDIVKRFGEPSRTEQLGDGQEVLIYDAHAIAI